MSNAVLSCGGLTQFNQGRDGGPASTRLLVEAHVNRGFCSEVEH